VGEVPASNAGHRPDVLALFSFAVGQELDQLRFRISACNVEVRCEVGPTLQRIVMAASTGCLGKVVAPSVFRPQIDRRAVAIFVDLLLRVAKDACIDVLLFDSIDLEGRQLLPSGFERPQISNDRREILVA